MKQCTLPLLASNHAACSCLRWDVFPWDPSDEPRRTRPLFGENCWRCSPGDDIVYVPPDKDELAAMDIRH